MNPVDEFVSMPAVVDPAYCPGQEQEQAEYRADP
jgi:hypothetical protein